MEERRQPSFDPEAAARAIADEELPDLETPVIDIQELEHQSWPDARIDTGGVEPPTQMDELVRREAGATRDEEDARKVGAEIARGFRDLPRGREIF